MRRIEIYLNNDSERVNVVRYEFGKVESYSSLLPTRFELCALDKEFIHMPVVEPVKEAA